MLIFLSPSLFSFEVDADAAEVDAGTAGACEDGCACQSYL